MMKITMTSGVVIELSDGESIPAVLIPMIIGAEPVTVTAAPVMDETPPAGPLFLPIEELSATEPPGECYLTKIEMDAMEVLQGHPKGITSGAVAAILGVTPSAASSTINRIRNVRPYRGSVDPLVVRLNGGLFRLTHFGSQLKYLVADGRKAPKLNYELGWGPRS